MKKLLYSMYVFIMLFPCIVFATDITVSNEEELLNAILDENVSLIKLSDDINISNSISINRLINIDGDSHTISYASDYLGNLFSVSIDGELSLSNVILDGNNAWSWKSEEDKIDPYKTSVDEYLNSQGISIASNVITVNGKLNVSNDVYIQNFFINDSTVAIINSTGTIENQVDVNLDKVTIKNCYGVIMMANYSNVQLNNSLVKDNYGYGNKGGLFQLSYTKFIINNTNIDNNLGRARSGSIFGVVNDSMLTMNSGTIRNNIAKYHGSASTGSMITLETGGGFLMNDGIITGNVGTLASVISSRWTDGTNGSGDGRMIFNGGTISDNTTYLETWNNASIYLRSNAVIENNMVIDGNVVVNSSSEGLVNNGTIDGDLIVNSSAASATNNGEVLGDTVITSGVLINNGTLNNVYQKDVSIENNGVISGECVKTLTPSTTQSVVTINGYGGRINDEYSSFDILVETGSNFSLGNYVEKVYKEGYTFKEEWYLDTEYTQKFEDNMAIESNVTLYAKYDINQYIVTWDIDGKLVEEKYDYNSVIKLPETPTKRGFIFVGWEGYDDKMVVPSNDIKFVALWKEIDNPDTDDDFVVLFKFGSLLVILILVALVSKIFKLMVRYKLSE